MLCYNEAHANFYTFLFYSIDAVIWPVAWKSSVHFNWLS